MKKSRSYVPFGRQDFKKLQKACRENRTIFCDELFPATNASIGDLNTVRDLHPLVESNKFGLSTNNVKKAIIRSDQNSIQPIYQWKRPFQLCEEANFLFSQKIGPSVSIRFFGTGNKWLIAAAIAVARQKKLLYRVLPKDLCDFFTGIFCVNLWKNGRWTRIIVDDRLPVNDTGQLLFSRTHNNVYWLPILEKAFAKLNGSYSTMLRVGNLQDTLSSLTGAPTEASFIRSTDDAKDYFRLISEELSNRSIIILKSKADINSQYNIADDNYFVVSKVEKPKTSYKNDANDHAATIRVIETIYADGSRGTAALPKYLKRKIHLKDFVKIFDEITICRLNVGRNRVVQSKRVCGSSQYCFDINSSYDEILIDLRKECDSSALGFELYQVESNRKYKIQNSDAAILRCSVEKRHSYSIFHRIRLENGRYILKPVCESQVKLTLRMYSTKNTKLRELRKDGPGRKFHSLRNRESQYISRIVIKNVDDLGKQGRRDGAANPYFIIRCGGEHVRSSATHYNLNPGFQNFSAIFYHRGGLPIIVEVWDSKFLKDKFIGRVRIMPELTSNPNRVNVVHEDPLYGKGKGQLKTGVLRYCIQTTRILRNFEGEPCLC